MGEKETVFLPGSEVSPTPPSRSLRKCLFQFKQFKLYLGVSRACLGKRSFLNERMAQKRRFRTEQVRVDGCATLHTKAHDAGRHRRRRARAWRKHPPPRVAALAVDRKPRGVVPAVAALRPALVGRDVVPRVLRAVGLRAAAIPAGRLGREDAQEWLEAVPGKWNAAPEVGVGGQHPWNERRG